MAAVSAKPDNRSTYVQVRLTEAEKAALQDAARQVGMSVSELVRARALGRRVMRDHEEAAGRYQAMEPKLFAHLARIGNNLNQIARAFNAVGNLDQAGALESVRDVWEIMLTDEVTARHAVRAEQKFVASRGKRP